MKIQVRQGVFETNSSSTHSLQITETQDEAYQVAICRAIKTEKEYTIKHPKFNAEDYMKDGNNLVLRGFEIADGNEECNIYYIISNWMAKIQYLAMVISQYISIYTGDIEYYGWEPELDEDAQKEINSRIIVTDLYNDFVGVIKDYFKEINWKNDVTVTYDLKYHLWTNYVPKEGRLKDVIEEKCELTKDVIKELFDEVMREEKTILYSDEAYCNLIEPEIYVI